MSAMAPNSLARVVTESENKAPSMQQKRALWKRNSGGQLRNMPHREATRVGTRDHTSMGLVGGERKGRRRRAAVMHRMSRSGREEGGRKMCCGR
jgi:hypothetical protein